MDGERVAVAKPDSDDSIINGTEITGHVKINREWGQARPVILRMGIFTYHMAVTTTCNLFYPLLCAQSQSKTRPHVSSS
jgi:hypothetical protein